MPTQDKIDLDGLKEYVGNFSENGQKVSQVIDLENEGLFNCGELESIPPL